MGTIRVINNKGKIKNVAIAVAENAAPRMGYWVEDENYEMVNGKVVKKTKPEIIKKATEPTEPTELRKDITESVIDREQLSDKDEIFAKYISGYDGGKVHYRNVIKVMEQATIEECQIIIQTENSQAVLAAFEKKQSNDLL